MLLSPETLSRAEVMIPPRLGLLCTALPGTDLPSTPASVPKSNEQQEEVQLSALCPTKVSLTKSL